MRVFAFVDRQKAEFKITTLCRVCRVSTSGYYDWAARRAAGPSDAEVAVDGLVERIRLVLPARTARHRGRPRSPSHPPNQHAPFLLERGGAYPTTHTRITLTKTSTTPAAGPRFSQQSLTRQQQRK